MTSDAAGWPAMDRTRVLFKRAQLFSHVANYLEVLQGRDPVAIAREEHRGLPAGAVEKVAAMYGVSQTRLCRTLGISISRWQRAKAGGRRLSRDASEGLSRYVRLHAQASRLLREPERWFQDPTPFLEGRTPFEMADTEAGGRAVEAILGRLETGGPA